MGFTPSDVDRMSVFQYMSALDGYAQAHGAEGDKSLSSDETDDIWSWLNSKEPIIVSVKG